MAWCYSCLLGEVAENGKKCPHCGADIPYIPPEKQAGATQTQIPLPVGTILQGKYLVGRFLGIGGNGITYVVRDMSLGLRLAVKEFFPNQNFQRDASLNVNCTNEGSLIVRARRRSLRSTKYPTGQAWNAGNLQARNQSSHTPSCAISSRRRSRTRFRLKAECIQALPCVRRGTSYS